MPLLSHVNEAMLPASMLKGFASVLSAQGGDAKYCCEHFDFDLAECEKEGRYIPHIAYVDLLEYSSRTFDLPFIGLQVARQHSLDESGTITPLLKSAGTLREALQYFVTYQPVHTPLVSYWLAETSRGLTELCWKMELGEKAPQRQSLEMTMGVIRKLISDLLQTDFRPSYVRIAASSPNERIAKLRRNLGFEVLYNQPVTSIAIPTVYLNTKLQTPDRFLADLFRSHLDKMRVQSDPPLSQQLISIISSTLTSGFCSLDYCAGQLCLSPRTLQSRLQEEGTSFSELLEQQRCTLAKKFLRDTKMPITQIAGTLGYSEQSTFSRAFRIWTGSSPSQFRVAISPDADPEDGLAARLESAGMTERERVLEIENAKLKSQLAAQAKELVSLKNFPHV